MLCLMMLVATSQCLARACSVLHNLPPVNMLTTRTSLLQAMNGHSG